MEVAAEPSSSRHGSWGSGQVSQDRWPTWRPGSTGSEEAAQRSHRDGGLWRSSHFLLRSVTLAGSGLVRARDDLLAVPPSFRDLMLEGRDDEPQQSSSEEEEREALCGTLALSWDA